MKSSFEGNALSNKTAIMVRVTAMTIKPRAVAPSTIVKMPDLLKIDAIPERFIYENNLPHVFMNDFHSSDIPQ